MRNFGFSRLHFKCDTVSADPIQYLENPEDCICSLRSISFIGEELCPSCFSSMITMLSKEQAERLSLHLHINKYQYFLDDISVG